MLKLFWVLIGQIFLRAGFDHLTDSSQSLILTHLPPIPGEGAGSVTTPVFCHPALGSTITPGHFSLGPLEWTGKGRLQIPHRQRQIPGLLPSTPQSFGRSTRHRRELASRPRACGRKETGLTAQVRRGLALAQTRMNLRTHEVSIAVPITSTASCLFSHCYLLLICRAVNTPKVAVFLSPTGRYAVAKRTSF